MFALGIISISHILTIQRILEQNDAGFRRVPGTALVNQSTGETVYTPPQDHKTITDLMDNLVSFINDESMSNLDPLIKMALIHFQFETIHPFYDGNGRTGRILNILYLVRQGLLDLPILYMSRFIIGHKADYYRLLQEVREKGSWEEWVVFMLKSVEETAKESIKLIGSIRELMQDYKHRIREQFPKIYNQDLLNNLFKHPYTKIEFIMHDMGVTRLTATRYLSSLVDAGYLQKHKIGISNFYMNEPLYQLLRTGIPSGQIADPIKTVQNASS